MYSGRCENKNEWGWKELSGLATLRQRENLRRDKEDQIRLCVRAGFFQVNSSSESDMSEHVTHRAREQSALKIATIPSSLISSEGKQVS